jgi:hypothetical protein
VNNKISKDADKILCTLYRYYLERCKDGYPKSDAQLFGNSIEIQSKYFNELLLGDITDACFELQRAGFISCYRSDDLANDITITDDTIVYMENRFKNGVIDVLKFISLFKP